MPITERQIQIFQMARFLWSLGLHPYPVPGVTKVRVQSYTNGRRTDGTLQWFEGLVLGPDYFYADPFQQRHGCPEEGVYLSGDPHWEQMWIVCLEDGKQTLEQHELREEHFVSGYRKGIPFLHWLFSPYMKRMWPRGRHKVSGLPFPIEFYPGDEVSWENDPGQPPRRVLSSHFDMRGYPTYTLSQTEQEWRAAQMECEKKERTTRQFHGIIPHPQEKYSRVDGGELELLRPGNLHCVAYGMEEGLSFPHVTLEVEFWSKLGIWKADEEATDRDDEDEGLDEDPPELGIEEALARLRSGEIDSVETNRDFRYSQITLPDRLAAFRERSRRASIEYLECFPGKYSFDVVPREVINAHEYGC